MANPSHMMEEPVRKKPNMDVINSINAALKGKSSSSSGFSDSKDSAESREERRRKRKSRWGGNDGIEKTFIPGMPTMMPQGLSKDQEEAYLRKCLFSNLLHWMTVLEPCHAPQPFRKMTLKDQRLEIGEYTELSFRDCQSMKCSGQIYVRLGFTKIDRLIP